MKLTKEDEALMTRLFGPFLPADDSAPWIESHRGVCIDGAVDENGEVRAVAVSTLISAYVHHGSEGRMPVGWTISNGEYGAFLTVLAPKRPLQAAAA